MKKLLLLAVLCALPAFSQCGAYSNFASSTAATNLSTAMNAKLSIQCGTTAPTSLAGTAGVDAYINTSTGAFYLCTITGNPCGNWALQTGAAWGAITGTLANQPDLSTALAGKQAALGFAPLNPSNNLSDVASATTARTNLGLGTAATHPSTDFAALNASTTVNGQTCALGGSCTISSGTTPISLTFNTTAGTCTVTAGTGTCTAGATAGYNYTTSTAAPGVVINDAYGTTSPRWVVGNDTSVTPPLQFGSAGSTAYEIGQAVNSANQVTVSFSSAAQGTLTDTLPNMGAAGTPGSSATVSVGTTTTLSAGSPASVTNSGSGSAAVFNFGIPQGVPGTPGSNGAISQIDNAGSALTVRPTLNFATGFTCVDNAGATRTDCSATASGGVNFTAPGSHIWTWMDQGVGTANLTNNAYAANYTANKVLCEAVPAASGGTVNRLLAFFRNGSAAGKGSALGIYSPSGSILGQATVVSANGQPQVFTLSSGVNLTAGSTYQFCFSTEDSISAGLYANVVSNTNMGLINTGTDIRLATAANTSTGTGSGFALPSTLGALTANNVQTNIADSVPYIQGQP